MRTVVVGGGVIGLTTAYQLAREGAEVTVLDARETGLGASAVNAGWFVPSEAMPVPGPGMVMQTMKWMLRRDSPVYIRPSVDPRFVRFMLNMWRRCNTQDQRAGFAAHLALAESTADVLDAYQADGIEFEMHRAGLLMAFTGPDLMHHHESSLDLARAHGVEPVVLHGDEVRVHEPMLSDAVCGGIFFPDERHLDPRAFGQSLHRRLLELGVTIIEGAPITSVQRARSGTTNRIAAVATPTGRIDGDAFVLAAGAWTGKLSALFGARLPVRPGKGYCIDLPPVGLRGATNLHDSKVAVTPFADRLRLAGTMEFAGLNERVNEVRVRAILRAPARYLRQWQAPDGPLIAQAGMRPMTPDGKPIIDALPGLANAYVSTGHGMLGVTLAPGSALALADLVLRGIKRPTLAPFTADRF